LRPSLPAGHRDRVLIRRETGRDADVIRGYQPRLRGMFTYPEPFDRT
jgi:hypothetical protein